MNTLIGLPSNTLSAHMPNHLIIELFLTVYNCHVMSCHVMRIMTDPNSRTVNHVQYNNQCGL